MKIVLLRNNIHRSIVEKYEAQLDLVFAALSDRTRRSILEQVRDKDCTVMELAKEFQMSLPAVSKHLKVLDRSGLLRRTKEGRFVICKFDPTTMQDALKWIERQHRFWNDGLDALETYLDANHEKEDTK